MWGRLEKTQCDVSVALLETGDTDGTMSENGLYPGIS
jgi:hypothetical protein